jgi:hypothetical protein
MPRLRQILKDHFVFERQRAGLEWCGVGAIDIQMVEDTGRGRGGRLWEGRVSKPLGLENGEALGLGCRVAMRLGQNALLRI